MPEKSELTPEQIAEAIAALSPEAALKVFGDVLAERDQPFAAAVTVYAANTVGVGAYGKRVRNEINPEEKGKNQFDIHLYGKLVASALNVVTYTDKEGEIHLLLIDKGKDRYHAPGGYVHPMEPGMPVPDRPVEGADYTMRATAIRELKEETGLTLPGKREPVLIGAPVDTMPEDGGLQTLKFFYLFDFGVRDNPPEVTLGDDLKDAEYKWVRVRDIEAKTKTKTDKHGIPRLDAFYKEQEIYAHHAAKMSEAIAMMRDGALERAGLDRPMVERYAKAATNASKDIFGSRPENEFGPEAAERHAKILEHKDIMLAAAAIGAAEFTRGL